MGAGRHPEQRTGNDEMHDGQAYPGRGIEERESTVAVDALIRKGNSTVNAHDKKKWNDNHAGLSAITTDSFGKQIAPQRYTTLSDHSRLGRINAVNTDNEDIRLSLTQLFQGVQWIEIEERRRRGCSGKAIDVGRRQRQTRGRSIAGGIATDCVRGAFDDSAHRRCAVHKLCDIELWHGHSLVMNRIGTGEVSIVLRILTHLAVGRGKMSVVRISARMETMRWKGGLRMTRLSMSLTITARITGYVRRTRLRIMIAVCLGHIHLILRGVRSNSWHR